MSLRNLQGSAVEDPETPMTRAPADEEPFSALAFKIMADKYVGTLTFCRVYRCVWRPLVTASKRLVSCCQSNLDVGLCPDLEQHELRSKTI